MGFGGGSGGGSGSVAGSSDVALSSPTNNQVLTYDTSVSKWKNATSSSSSSTIITRVWRSGAYPALPASKPAGVDIILFTGPEQPTSGNVTNGIPSYMGNGASQIPAGFDLNTELS